MNQLYLFLGSLGAVLALAAIAWALGLGGGEIESEAEAMRVAEDALPGFEPVRAQLGTDRKAALVHGRDGSVALLKLHGAQIAARRLAAYAATPTSEGLLVASGERRFGSVLLRGVSASRA